MARDFCAPPGGGVPLNEIPDPEAGRPVAEALLDGGDEADVSVDATRCIYGGVGVDDGPAIAVAIAGRLVPEDVRKGEGGGRGIEGLGPVDMF